MTDPHYRWLADAESFARQAAALATSARERGAHDVAEQYETAELRHRQTADRLRRELSR